jgi:hypothetical protein
LEKNKKNKYKLGHCYKMTQVAERCGGRREREWGEGQTRKRKIIIIGIKI